MPPVEQALVLEVAVEAGRCLAQVYGHLAPIGRRRKCHRAHPGQDLSSHRSVNAGLDEGQIQHASRMDQRIVAGRRRIRLVVLGLARLGRTTPSEDGFEMIGHCQVVAGRPPPLRRRRPGSIVARTIRGGEADVRRQNCITFPFSMCLGMRPNCLRNSVADRIRKGKRMRTFQSASDTPAMRRRRCLWRGLYRRSAEGGWSPTPRRGNDLRQGPVHARRRHTAAHQDRGRRHRSR
mmetsp:Transcript_133662/g.427196  ORF Transcript_133662/g.427196 Transcript_133662/m.427196 type:complete len:235 (+) Transcript_133662:2106-2810(+)